MKRKIIPKNRPASRSSAYQATADELAAIDEGLEGEAASAEEVEAVFARFRRGIASSLRSSQ
jgi:hypothetical protein